MKKIVVFAITVVMVLSLCVTAFASPAPSDTAPLDPTFAARLVGVNAPSTAIYAGNSFNISFRIQAADNYGGRAVATVSGSGFTVDGSIATREFENVGENTVLTVPVYCDSDTKTGRYPVVLSVSYTNKDGVTVNLSQNLNINVVGLTQYDPPEPPENDGSVYLSVTSAPSKAVMSGETFKISFDSRLDGIYNYNGNYVGGTVTVSGAGFSLAGAFAEQDISSGKNTINVLCDSGVATGRQQLTLTVTYKIGKESYSESKVLNIDVIGTEEEPEKVDESKNVASFRFVGASIPEKKGRSDLSTTLTLEFENDSDFEAKNVKVRLGGLGEIILNTFTDVADAGNVEAGGIVTAYFPIKFPEFPKAQTTLVAEVVYDTAAGEKSESYNIYLQATEKSKEEATPESAALTPKVIVKNYSVDVDNVTSGEEFTLSFTLENTSAEKDLRNMTVDITPKAPSSGTNSSGPVFSFIDGASSFYTPVLEKGSTKEYSIRLKCSASAGAGSYPIEISFDFEYANAGGYSSGRGQMDVNLPVVQPVKFELMEWEPPTECGLDGTSISFQYYNKSRNPMTSLSISVEGDFEMATQYVGTLNAASLDYFNGMITPLPEVEAGETKTAILVFTFEDAAGNEGRIEYPFDIKVNEMMGGDMFAEDMIGDIFGDDMMFDDMDVSVIGDPMPPPSSTFPNWAKIAIAFGVVALIAAVAAVSIKKSKAKREEDEDEE